MINVVRAELTKLRRPSLSLSTIAAVTFVIGLVTSLLFLLVDSPEGNGERGIRIGRDVLSLATGVSIGFSNSAGLLGIVALCIFAAQTAQEYTYGTLRNLLVRQPSRMKILIGKLISMKLFAIAIQKQLGNQAFSIFILPPSLEVLQERLAKRNTDTAEKIQMRLDKAAYEISFSNQFNAVVKNEELDAACEQTAALIQGFISK